MANAAFAPCQLEALAPDGAGPVPVLPASRLQPGDRVRVRSAEEIAGTLDPRGTLRGCAFGAGMVAACGRELRVLKRVEHLFDEHDWRLLRVNDVVYLEGSVCDGSTRPGGCDLLCQFAWRAEWLVKPGDEPRARPAPPSREEPWRWWLRRKALSALWRVRKLLRPAPAGPPPPPPARLPAAELKAGDRVRVRPAAEIRAALDPMGRLKGCIFAWGQYPLCGKEFRVARRVERFWDVRSARMVKLRNMVILEGVFCDGSDLPESRGCDRMCHYFWRTEWLEKIDGPP